MNFTNLFSKKPNTPQAEYFLAVEIHESLIKTALWEVQNGESSVVNVGTYELWADEDSLINGIDSSLEQAVKVISGQPNRVIFGLPDSWMEEDKIHPTKIKLVSRICKELGLEPIGAVTINRAVAHYLKKRDGVPPTAILLELYTTKISLSYIYLGEVKATEEVAKSGDIGSDVEEGLTRMDLPNYPARFILTNGSDLADESQQVTAHPWQDRLPFKHLPKVEPLPVDFSIKAIALIGGTEAVRYMGLPIKEEKHSPPENHSVLPTLDQSQYSTPSTVDDLSSTATSVSDSDNLQVPEGDIQNIEEHGFFYEEVEAPNQSSLHLQNDLPTDEVFLDDQLTSSDIQDQEPDISGSDDRVEIIQPSAVFPKSKSKFKFTFPKIGKLPKFPFPKFKFSFGPLLLIPLLLIAGVASYFYFGKVIISLFFNPQSFNQNLTVFVADTPRSDKPTLVAITQKVSGSTKETTATTGTATVGERAVGLVTIANKTVAPLVIKKGTVLTTDNGKYSFSVDEEVTVASASSGLLDVISGKATGVKVTATKIGPEYNLSAENTLTVDSYSRTVAIAITEKEFAGGTSRSVNAVSKADQDKLIAQATDKIKQLTDSQVTSATPGKKTIPLSELQLTKKVFDKNIGEESTTLSLDMEASLDTFVYTEQDLFTLVDNELKAKLPSGSVLKPNSTNIKVESLQKKDGEYQANVSIAASLYPVLDEEKLKQVVKGKQIDKIRPFFDPIKGFTGAQVKITPPIPLLSKYLPLKNIEFDLIAN